MPGLKLRLYLFIENIPTNSKTFKPWCESLLIGCKTSNVWLPSTSCLHLIRTCFPITCPRLGENDGNLVITICDYDEEYDDQELDRIVNVVVPGLPRNKKERKNTYMYTAVSTKVVQQESIKVYATIPKGMMGCGCSLFHRQVHEFSVGWKAVL